MPSSSKAGSPANWETISSGSFQLLPSFRARYIAGVPLRVRVNHSSLPSCCRNGQPSFSAELSAARFSGSVHRLPCLLETQRSSPPFPLCLAEWK
ncbi:hypothetical protein AUJ65_02855 [Candidatus Micrarchaeota archaeon CG1_02_51_15]|nr:MAG: hypothetical protein AUJ65_02855 [Candidatus Micrarchaeota archaeon CG1_02_51_15]